MKKLLPLLILLCLSLELAGTSYSSPDPNSSVEDTNDPQIYKMRLFSATLRAMDDNQWEQAHKNITELYELMPNDKKVKRILEDVEVKLRIREPSKEYLERLREESENNALNKVNYHLDFMRHYLSAMDILESHLGHYPDSPRAQEKHEEISAWIEKYNNHKQIREESMVPPHLAQSEDILHYKVETHEAKDGKMKIVVWADDGKKLFFEMEADTNLTDLNMNLTIKDTEEYSHDAVIYFDFTKMDMREFQLNKQSSIE